jgi:polyisoprenoid-binding protein YceI
MIVYQNFRGRSIYQGRTTTLKRIRNFIRTSRFVPQGEAPYFRDNIPIWNYHQAQIWAPLKVAPVTGTVPDTYNHRTFVKEARTSIAKGFKSFQIKERVELGRSDRGFYMDFYPWLSEDGTLFLSLALFSQFHCKKPVFEKKDDPLTGPWKDRNALFTRAAKIMEDAVQTCIQESEGGDGFDIVPPDIPVVSWKDLGFPLPQAPEEKTAGAPIDMEIPRVWVVTDPGIDEPPLIQFRFSAPLDNYSGEVTRARGEIYLSQGPTLIGTTGFIETDPLSVTMGESQLDQTIQGSLFLYSKKHPKAKFVIGKVSTDGQPLGYGRLSQVSVSGIFTLKGKDFPLMLNTEIEPVIGEKGKPLLLARGSFQIDLRDFDIEGAEGPAPAKYTLELEINLRMHAKE